eukprot:COSAG02_NODE_7721_length_2875_cov_32.125360_2_plen_76_part_00
MTGEGGETMNGCQSLDMGDAKGGEGVRGGLSGATGRRRGSRTGMVHRVLQEGAGMAWMRVRRGGGVIMIADGLGA